MRLGFSTSSLGDQPLDSVAGWAAEVGFDVLEIDVDSHLTDLSRAHTAIGAVRREGIEVCALTVFGNLLDADETSRKETRHRVQASADAAIESKVPMLVIFPGRDAAASEDDNYRQLADYLAPLVAYAARGNLKVLMENWPGPNADYLATTPAGWERLFSLVPAPNLGLNFDPSHLIWQGIDPDKAVREVAGRVFLTHAKDTEIFPERVQRVGYFGSGWWTYRLPGHGLIEWRRWLALLQELGFEGVVSVEHEDPDWGGSGEAPLPRRREGLLEALRVLREARGAHL